MSDYDSFAEIYDVWAATSARADRNLTFYVQECVRTEGPVVELGVGSGRVAVEACRQGKPLLGIDDSPVMLERCRLHARRHAVTDMLRLEQADIRSFVAPEPPELVTMPFRTLGHLMTQEDRRQVIQAVYDQLAPGGRFVCDHFLFQPRFLELQGIARLRKKLVEPQSRRELVLWYTTQYDLAANTLTILTWTDELHQRGVVATRRYRELTLSWVTPQEMKQLLEGAGFLIEGVYGDYGRSPLAPESDDQIWVAWKA